MKQNQAITPRFPKNAEMPGHDLLVTTSRPKALAAHQRTQAAIIAHNEEQNERARQQKPTRTRSPLFRW